MPLKATSLRAVNTALVAAVNEAGGTATGAALAGIKAKLAGKTGTAQVARLSNYRGADEPAGHLRDHSLFVGYTPAEAPRFAVAAVVEHGGAGSKTAAPLVRDVMRLLFERFEPELVAEPVPPAPVASGVETRGG
jgi:penicillin-binding protein 2